MNIKDEMNIIEEKISKCERCTLHLTRNKTVPGTGNIKTDIVFVGEGPGEEEDKSGLPFVGRAGEMLDKLLNENAKLQRENIFIANIVKCRPPKNRTPNEEEVLMCTPYLEAQLMLLNPKIIVALGGTALKYFTGESKITKSRGSFFKWYGNTRIFATFHPSYLLRSDGESGPGSPIWLAQLDMSAIGFMYKALEKNIPVEEIVKKVELTLQKAGGA